MSSQLTENPAHAISDYRPDIDGLRALAVLPVVLFHIGFRGFYGGYVGVDVFFVISGYLITRILYRELQTGSYSITNFYRRRVQRIFPALFVMMACVSLVALLTMLPSELVRYSKSTASATGFVSNIYFYMATNYFAPASSTAPLLHTWSLAVEEQFYLFWPLILALIARLNRRHMLAWVVALTIASFVASVIWLRIDKSATFYLIPTRTWELLIGGILVFLPANLIRRAWLAETLAAAGVLMILVCCKIYTETAMFPAEGALWPCLGAALIIASGGAHKTFVTRILSFAPVVFIGQLSFSLYLWHWPVIVFAHTVLMWHDTFATKLILLAASFGLAWLSWKFVEAPFRQPWLRRYSNWKVLGTAGAVMGAFLVLAGLGIALKGLPQRFTAEQQKIAAFEDYDGDSRYRGGTCFIVEPGTPYDAAKCLATRPGHKHVLLIGDSHSAHLWPGLAQALPDIDILQANETGCRPVISPLAANERPCQTFNRDMLTNWIHDHPVDAIILAGRWAPSDMADLNQTLKTLAPQVPVILVGPAPQYSTSLPRLLVKADQSGSKAIVSEGLMPDPFERDRQMRTLAQTVPGVRFISLTDALCPNRKCRTLATEDVPMQFDYGHFTVEGSVVAATIIAPVVRDTLSRPMEAQ